MDHNHAYNLGLGRNIPTVVSILWRGRGLECGMHAYFIIISTHAYYKRFYYGSRRLKTVIAEEYSIK